MGPSPPRLLGRQRSVHHILGGGFVADVVLWRRKKVPVTILIGMLAAWIIFHISGYTLVSLISNVLLLLISILFVWAKAAALLNRPPPPIPVLRLSEEFINDAAIVLHSFVTTILDCFHDIALGKNSTLFYKVAACLWLLSFVSSGIDFLTFCYASIVIVLTLPVMYEKFEDSVDGFIMLAFMEMKQHGRLYVDHVIKASEWILEKKEKLN